MCPPRLPAAFSCGPFGARGGLLYTLSCLTLLAVLGLCAAPSARAAAQPDDTGSTTLPYGGLVQRDSALAIARAQAYLQALTGATSQLEQHRAALFGAASHLRREALAASIHRPSVSIVPTTGVLPPAGEVTARVHLTTPPRTVDARLREMLPLSNMLDMRELLLVQMRASAEEGEELTRKAALRRQQMGSEGDRIYEQRLAYLGKRLEALWILDEALTLLRGTWSDPVPTARALRKTTELDPRNPLLWAALGEVQLQMDQPQNSLTSLNTALRQEPDMARALYARGLAHLRLQQPALAEADLSAALRLSPGHASWLRARGAVRMVREEFDGMCEDFEQACALGDCEGLAAARKRLLCLPAAAPATVESGKQP